MTEKQYRKADGMVFATLMVLIVGIFLNMLGMAGGNPSGPNLLVTAGSVIGGITAVVLYLKLKGKRCCGIALTIVAMIVWALMVILIDAQFFYMLAAAILVAQMAYLEKKRILITAIIILPIYTIRSMMLAMKGSVSLTEAGTSVVILILILVSVYNISKIWILFNNETLETVRRVSEELVVHFEQANGRISALDEVLKTNRLTMEDISTNVENTANEILNQSQKCQDIEVNSRSAKDKTEGMVQASGKALEEVASGKETMIVLHEQAQDVERENQITIQNVEALNERTKAVQNILGTISGISTKTHLLAMNALIEASRAGDAGKGFAVVADEIKALAEQTKTATEDITSILSQLEEDVERVTDSINHSVEVVEQQNQLIEESNQKFDAIDDGVTQLIENIQEFKLVIDGITEATIVIADGVTELSANSQEVASASVEGTTMMAEAVDDMERLERILKDIYVLAENLRNEYNVQ